MWRDTLAGRPGRRANPGQLTGINLEEASDLHPPDVRGFARDRYFKFIEFGIRKAPRKAGFFRLLLGRGESLHHAAHSDHVAAGHAADMPRPGLYVPFTDETYELFFLPVC